MKLIRCHIENFGGLSNFDYSFTDGLNVLCEPNGFGKSTLAAFIKAMFYGFPRTTSTDLSKNERKKYLPWQGGSFGGSLEFLYDDTHYRITRFFGKTASSDSFSLYDVTRRQDSTRFSRDIGVELFRLDADSFLRSTYMPQQQGRIDFSTDSIRAKLSNLVEDTNDINNYDTTVEKLKSKRAFYEAYRGAGGQVNKLRNSIEDVKSRLESLSLLNEQREEAIDKLNCCENRYTKLCRERDSLQAQISALSTREAEQERHNSYLRLKNNSEDIKGKLNELNLQYPVGYPSDEEIITFNSDADAFSDICRQLSGLREPLEAKELVKREQSFWEGRDAEADIQKAQELLDALNTVGGRLLQHTVSQEEQADYNNLHAQFCDGVPDDEMRRSYMQKADERSEKIAQCRLAKLSTVNQERLERHRQLLGDTLSTEKEKPFRRNLLFLLAGAWWLLGGGICLLLSLPKPSVIFFMLGAIWLAVGFSGGKRSQNASRSEDSLQVISLLQKQEEEYAKKREELTRDIKALEQEMGDFLVAYGLAPSDGDFRSALDQLNTKIIQYETLRKRLEEGRETTRQLTERQNELRGQLGELASSYQCDFDLSALPQHIRQRLSSYLDAKKDLSSYQENLTRLTAQKEDIKRKLQQVLITYKLTGSYQELARKLREDKNAYDRLSKELLDATNDLKQFLSKNPQAAEAPMQQMAEAENSLSSLNLKRENLDLEIDQIEKEERPSLREKLYTMQQELEKMPGLQDQLAGFEDEYEKATLARDRLNKAISFLEQAKTELSTRYVSQVEQQFQIYAHELIGDEMGEMELNHELNIRLEQYGKAHELDYYSVGSIDSIMLCMHLALADILFTGETSFIILDDPFVNLDDARTERALTLLEKLAGTRQILYLVCNSSRSI